MLSLTRDDFWNGYDKVTGVTTLNPTRKKTNEHYYTFLNPEATAAVKQMLKERTDEDSSYSNSGRKLPSRACMEDLMRCVDTCRLKVSMAR